MDSWYNSTLFYPPMKILLAIAIAAVSFSEIRADSVVTNAADLARLVYRDRKLDVVFDLHCTVSVNKSVLKDTKAIYAIDHSGGAILFSSGSISNAFFQAGCHIHARGHTVSHAPRQVVARCESIEVMGYGSAPKPEEVSITDFRSGRFDCHYVKMRGTLRDAFDDEVDGNYTYLVLNCEGKLLYAPTPRFKVSNGMIGAEVEIAGICDPMSIGERRYMGYTLLVQDINAIRILKASDEDAFAVPDIDETQNLGPMEIQALGKRRTHGTVLAAWRPNNILISTKRKRPIFATIANQPLPVSGTSVEVAGLPETDLFSISLSRAVWRPSGDSPTVPQKLDELDFDKLFGGIDENRRIRPFYNGMVVHIKGDVVGFESAEGHLAEISISDGKRILTVDTSVVPGAADDVRVGCRIDVTGVCVLETDNWRPGALFPPASGYRIVVRRPNELRILAYPPWWTPGRLFVVIGILAAALVLLLLRMALKRRFGAIIAKAKIDARVGERTRLAVELHDSIAQNLTGVAMEIRSAKRAKTADPSGMDRHLDLAAATLDSCRSELRNCIWDLRSLTLDEATIDEAIRRTLQQHLSGARLEVRFSADRRLFPDSMLHAILRIMRELTINAVRHGRADDIKVAGCIDGGRLHFSVRDNGRGFDPERAPGIRDGHFGLQGIRERIETLEGTIEIESAVGRGTKVSMSLPLPMKERTGEPWEK